MDGTIPDGPDLKANEHANSLMARWKITGWPTLLALDSRARVIDRLSGCRTADVLLEWLPRVRSIAEAIEEIKALGESEEETAEARTLRLERLARAAARAAPLRQGLPPDSALVADLAEVDRILGRETLVLPFETEGVVRAGGAVVEIAPVSDRAGTWRIRIIESPREVVHLLVTDRQGRIAVGSGPDSDGNREVRLNVHFRFAAPETIRLVLAPKKE